jgi:hypothetical protein
VTTQVITPTLMVPDGAGLNLTAALAAPTGTTLQFSNTGKEFLAIVNASSTPTLTVDVGVTVLGQAVTAFSSVTLTATDVFLFGPFHSLLDQPGGTTVQVVLSTDTGITCALVQFVGVS